MASPNFDALSVQHSRNMNDLVATAATDGATFSSAQRTNHLNQACRRWLVMASQAGSKIALGGYILTANKAMTSNAVSLTDAAFSNGIFKVLGVVNATPTPDVYVKELPEPLYGAALVGLNKFLTPSATDTYWVVANGNLVVLGSGATDSLSVHFIQKHADLSAGGSTDILVPSQSWPQILDLARMIGEEDRGLPPGTGIQAKAQDVSTSIPVTP